MAKTSTLSEPRAVLARIDSRVEAAGQFLLILIGLGLTNGVTRFGAILDESRKTHSFYVVALIYGAFMSYGMRSFFNNWVYLPDSYPHKEFLSNASA
jgi:hypothetical protein